MPFRAQRQERGQGGSSPANSTVQRIQIPRPGPIRPVHPPRPRRGSAQCEPRLPRHSRHRPGGDRQDLGGGGLDPSGPPARPRRVALPRFRRRRRVTILGVGPVGTQGGRSGCPPRAGDPGRAGCGLPAQRRGESRRGPGARPGRRPGARRRHHSRLARPGPPLASRGCPVRPGLPARPPGGAAAAEARRGSWASCASPIWPSLPPNPRS